VDELDGLLAAIKHDPADDTARLVYADALDDRGEAARAAFVRGQVERARLQRWDDPRVAMWRPKLPPRTSRLPDVLAADPWAAFDMASSPHVSVFAHNAGMTGVVWHRGFVEMVACSLLDWMEYGPAIVEKHPVRHVHVFARSCFNADGNIVIGGGGPADGDVKVYCHARGRTKWPIQCRGSAALSAAAVHPFVWEQVLLETHFPGIAFDVSWGCHARRYPVVYAPPRLNVNAKVVTQ
jgi:uncharacterized protein (TIGR02996 family)